MKRILLLAVIFLAGCSKKENFRGISSDTNLTPDSYSISGKVSVLTYSRIDKYKGFTMIFLGRVYQEDNIIIQLDSQENKLRIKGNLGTDLAPNYDEYDGVSHSAIVKNADGSLTIKGLFRKEFDIQINATVK